MYDHSVIDYICHRGDLKVLEYWYQKYLSGVLRFEYTRSALNEAILKGHINIVKWWVEHDLLLKYSHKAFFTLHLSMLKYLAYEQNTVVISMPYEIIDRTCTSTCTSVDEEKNVLDILNFWYEHKNTFEFKYSSHAMDNASVNVLQWWFDHRDGLELKYTSESMDHGRLGILQWWFDHKDELELKYTEKSILYALLVENIPIIEWWYVKRFELKPNVPEYALRNAIENNVIDCKYLALIDGVS